MEKNVHTVFVVVVPHIHELIGGKFLDVASLRIPELAHEVSRLFQVELLASRDFGSTHVELIPETITIDTLSDARDLQFKRLDLSS
jgi:hypothetical protein